MKRSALRGAIPAVASVLALVPSPARADDARGARSVVARSALGLAAARPARGTGSCRPPGQRKRGLDLRSLCPPEEMPAEVPPERPPARRDAVEEPKRWRDDGSDTAWYGWQILGADLAAVLLAGVGAGSGSPLVALLGAPLYLVPAPLIHLGHDQGNLALLSLGMRLVVPTAGGLVGNRAARGCKTTDDSNEPTYCEISGTLEGVLLGMLAVTVTDAMLASEPATGPDERGANAWTIGVRGSVVWLGGSF